LQLLLDGSKTWEVRSYATKVRGRIALASTDTKLLYGDVELVDCTPLAKKDLAATAHKHCIQDADTTAMVLKYKQVFAWHVARPRSYVEATPFPNPVGSVIFVLLHEPSAIFAHTKLAEPVPGLPPRSRSPSLPASVSSACSATPRSEDSPSAPVAPPGTVASLQGLPAESLLDERYYDAGLLNVGNTCFFNALCVCLSTAVPFADRLLRHLRHHSNAGGNENCLRCHLANDFALLCQRGRPESFRPATVAALAQWAPLFVPGQQQCVGETFTLLADALDAEDFNDVAHLVTPSNVAGVKATTVSAEHFSVAWRQTRRCLNPACGDLHVQPASNFGLQLELPPNSVTVLELLEEHFQTERVNDFQCEACDVRGSCELSKPVHRWPPVLFLHVKRFRLDATGRMRKISEPLFFEEVLESAAFGVRYSLQAVAVHLGRFGSGHYVAYVRDSQDQWVLLNDAAEPAVVSFQEVQRKQAYVLVFRLSSAT
jgi:ubiquitin C-terminal hydrolase